MKLSYHQFLSHIKNQLLPVYLVMGNEPLLLQEVKEDIFQKAKNQGFSEVQRHDTTQRDYNWNNLLESACSYSLFSERVYFEVKIAPKINAETAKNLDWLLKEASPHRAFTFISNKLENTTLKQNWFQTVNNLGAIITIWPLEKAQFLQWLKKRLQQFNLPCHPALVQILSDQTEGNLLAAAQEIEKLSLLFPTGHISAEQLFEAITDNARYTLFNFIDTLFEGDLKKIISIIHKFKNEEMEPALLLWAVTREIRLLVSIYHDLKQNVSWQSIFKKNQVWEKRQPLIKNILKKQTLEGCHQLILACERLDKIIKGMIKGNFWEEFKLFSLQLNALPLLPSNLV